MTLHTVKSYELKIIPPNLLFKWEKIYSLTTVTSLTVQGVAECQKEKSGQVEKNTVYYTSAAAAIQQLNFLMGKKSLFKGSFYCPIWFSCETAAVPLKTSDMA